MKNRVPVLGAAVALCALLLFSVLSFAQTPGLIVRPIGGSGITPLNPDGNGYTSPTTAGFITTDVGAGYSEIPYKVIPPFTLEPTADLMRGPANMFSDLVRLNSDESGFYV